MGNIETPSAKADAIATRGVLPRRARGGVVFSHSADDHVSYSTSSTILPCKVLGFVPIKSGLRFSLFILSKVKLFRYGTRKVTTDIKVCSVCCLLLLGSCFLVMLLL